jgi:hypothetical protein
MKKCKECGIEKELNQFYNNFRLLDGKFGKCKDCVTLDKRNHYLKNKKTLLRKHNNYNKKFPWKKTLSNIKTRCNNINSKDYKDYGARGIKCLITAAELKVLWFRDKAYEMKEPTIDRKNNNGHYIFDNCRYLENKDNIIKRNRNYGKEVLQFTLDNKFIKEWSSIKEASINVNGFGCNISFCCKGKAKTAYGFIWRYKE